jgi:hypothetical protein
VCSVVARNVLIPGMRPVSAIVLGLAVLLAAGAADAQTWERKPARALAGMTLGVVVTAPLPAPEELRTILEPELPYFAMPPATAAAVS